jgi:hypothetical protein
VQRIRPRQYTTGLRLAPTPSQPRRGFPGRKKPATDKAKTKVAERLNMDPTIGWPIRRLCRWPGLHELPRDSAGPHTDGKYEHGCSSVL